MTKIDPFQSSRIQALVARDASVRPAVEKLAAAVADGKLDAVEAKDLALTLAAQMNKSVFVGLAKELGNSYGELGEMDSATRDAFSELAKAGQAFELGSVTHPAVTRPPGAERALAAAQKYLGTPLLAQLVGAHLTSEVTTKEYERFKTTRTYDMEGGGTAERLTFTDAKSAVATLDRLTMPDGTIVQTESFEDPEFGKMNRGIIRAVSVDGAGARDGHGNGKATKLAYDVPGQPGDEWPTAVTEHLAEDGSVLRQDVERNWSPM